MEIFQRVVSFLVGVLIVVFAIFDTCPRVGAIVVGLLLMGIFTVPEALRLLVRRGEGEKNEP
jgi:hypothetical protein